MIYRRERPRCRKMIERLLSDPEWPDTLERLLEQPHRLSDGMRKQARKMLQEGTLLVTIGFTDDPATISIYQVSHNEIRREIFDPNGTLRAGGWY